MLVAVMEDDLDAIETFVTVHACDLARRLACETHGYDPECERCEYMTPFRSALNGLLKDGEF